MLWIAGPAVADEYVGTNPPDVGSVDIAGPVVVDDYVGTDPPDPGSVDIAGPADDYVGTNPPDVGSVDALEAISQRRQGQLTNRVVGRTPTNPVVGRTATSDTGGLASTGPDFVVTLLFGAVLVGTGTVLVRRSRLAVH